MFGLFTNEIKKIGDIADKVLALEGDLRGLSDDELKLKTKEFRTRLENGEKLDDLLVEAFATVREATYRVEGISLYREQIMGAIVMNGGNLAELKTGEGKTNTVTMAVYLNALTGKGVHIVTVNEYLAARDAEWMGKIYKFLGLTVGVNLRDMTPAQKRKAYACDILYTTNAELGFDYLRDNMVTSAADRVMRGLHTAFIDEADSVLIDEARTPLIISGGAKKTANLYKDADKFVKTLVAPTYEYDKVERKKKCVSGDYSIEERSRQIALTGDGQKKAEEFFKVPNLYGVDNTQIVHHVNQALKANYVMTRDVEYLINADNEVVLIDQSTGRLLPGRAYSDGLNQAIEAKEGVPIKAETATLATITYQNFFRLYDKLAGMTGTAKTEENEFVTTYNMKVIVIPEHKPCIRDDKIDFIFFTKEAKYKAIVKEVKEEHAKGRPVLIGTPSVEVSEVVAEKLKEAGIRFVMLNAKNHAKEAEIISHAGEIGAVTLATNMAGRGTDIKLGDGVKELGGLAVIGVERHQARRIDNQLRGRAGRQGDPGSSRFFVSLEDELLVRFGCDKLARMSKITSEEMIASTVVSKSITNAQVRIEGLNFDNRKQVLDYDDVLRRQREIIYKQRNRLLDEQEVHDMVHRIFDDAIGQAVEESSDKKGIDLDILKENLSIMGVRIENMPDGDKLNSYKKDRKKMISFLRDFMWTTYEEGISTIRKEYLQYEKAVVLRNIDRNWIEHIDKMDKLRSGIYLRSYAQNHPLQQYVDEGYRMFEVMNAKINRDIAFFLMQTKVQSPA